MFDIGWSELLVIAVVAIVVVGPKELPRMMRTVGFYAGKVRRAASDFQRQFEEAMRESEAEEVRKNIESIRSDLKSSLDEPTNKPLMTAKTEPANPQIAETAAPAKRKAAPKPKTAKAKGTDAKSAKPRQAKPRQAKTAAAKGRATKAESST